MHCYTIKHAQYIHSIDEAKYVGPSVVKFETDLLSIADSAVSAIISSADNEIRESMEKQLLRNSHIPTLTQRRKSGSIFRDVNVMMYNYSSLTILRCPSSSARAFPRGWRRRSATTSLGSSASRYHARCQSRTASPCPGRSASPSPGSNARPGRGSNASRFVNYVIENEIAREMRSPKYNKSFYSLAKYDEHGTELEVSKIVPRHFPFRLINPFKKCISCEK